MKKNILLISVVIVTIFLYWKNFHSSEGIVDKESNKGTLSTKYVNAQSEIDQYQLTDEYSHADSATEIQYSEFSLGSRFEESDNLYGFALELYDLAVDGNNEAQFYLANTMAYCHNPSLSDTEIDSVVILELHDWMRTRCAGFIEQNISELGDVDTWLNLSAKGKYPQALVANLLVADKIPRNQSILKDLQLALNSKHNEVMNLLGDLAQAENNRLTAEAWRFLACDYGYDCSPQSKGVWRLWQGYDCSLATISGQKCSADLDYVTYRKPRYTTVEFEQIMTKVRTLKKAIDSDRIDELTIGQILE